MSQLPFAGDAPSSGTLTAALQAWSEYRAHEIGVPLQTEEQMISHETEVAGVARAMHEAMSEADRLLVYRFFLTAVHRNATVNRRYAASNVSSPERQAAMWAEFDNVSVELDELVVSVATAAKPLLGESASLLAADFLWSMTWWTHVRRDVLAFVPFAQAHDEVAVVALGRPPAREDHVAVGMYDYASHAVNAYRNARRSGFRSTASAILESPHARALRRSTANTTVTAGTHM